MPLRSEVSQHKAVSGAELRPCFNQNRRGDDLMLGTGYGKHGEWRIGAARGIGRNTYCGNEP